MSLSALSLAKRAVSNLATSALTLGAGCSGAGAHALNDAFQSASDASDAPAEPACTDSIPPKPDI
jgi:hypothetical protein